MSFTWNNPIPTKLRWLNRARWLRHHWVSWGLLGGISSLIGAQVLGIAFQLLFKEEPTFAHLFLLLGMTMAIPGFLQWLPGQLRFVGAFPGKIPLLGLRILWGPPIVHAFVVQELRRVSFWVATLAVATAGYAIPVSYQRVWVWIALAIPLRVIFAIEPWKPLFRMHSPVSGVIQGFRAALAVTGASLILAILLMVGRLEWIWGALMGPNVGGVVGAGRILGTASLVQFGQLIAGAVAASLGALFMMWEGDSGRPWLVHGMALGIGILCGIAGVTHWLSVLFIAYVGLQHLAAVPRRLRSLEHVDEDCLL